MARQKNLPMTRLCELRTSGDKEQRTNSRRVVSE